MSVEAARVLPLRSGARPKIVAKNIKEFSNGLKILNGPYGPYVTDGKKNARISKDQDPAAITEEQAKKLIEEAPAKKRGFGRRRTTKKS